MRVIAGRFKGRPLSAVPGRDTRPTSDKVREAWASSVISLGGGFDQARVLDAFAGSGALGIEALSRGAEAVLFADNNARAVSTIRKNLMALGLADDPGVKLLRTDSLAPSAAKRLAQLAPYSLVVLDPPYSYRRERVAGLLSALIKAGALEDGCLVSYERRAGDDDGMPAAQADGSGPGGDGGRAAQDQGGGAAAAWPSALELVSCKRYGDSAIEYFCYHADRQ